MKLEARFAVHHGPHRALSNARASWSERASVLFEVRGERAVGVGEACPLPGHSPDTLSEVVAQLSALDLHAAGIDGVVPELGETPAYLEKLRLPSAPSARFAVEAALLDYWGRLRGVPAWQLLTRAPVASSLRTSLVIDPLASDLEHQVESALASGVTTAKLKIGRDAAAEAHAVERLRQRFTKHDLRLRLDANRAWSAAEAVAHLAAYRALDIELVEEPTHEPWPTPSERTVPWALDESLVGIEPSAVWLRERDAHAVVLKPMLLGGCSRCVRWAEAARETGARVIVSHLFDGPVALAATTQLAFAVQSPELAAGLGRHAGLDAWRGACAAPSYITASALDLPKQSGLGLSALPTASFFDGSLSVLRAAEEHPERVALCLGARRLTYRELAEHVAARLAELEASGAAAACRASGRPIAITALPTLEALTVLYACLEGGLPALPLHPRLDETERERIIERARPAFMVALNSEGHPQDATHGKLTSNDAAKDSARPMIEPEHDLAWLMTSGSTGAPKAVRLSRRAFLASATANEDNLGWVDEDRWLLSIPWAHVGGLSVLVRCLIARRTVVIDEKLPLAAWTAFLDEQRVTLLSLVPTQLGRLLESPDFAFPERVRAILLGGAPVTPALLERARARRAPVLPAYGLTETCSQVVTARYDALAHPAPADIGLVGPPLRDVEVRITDAGAVALRGPSLFSGYADAPSPFDENGWLVTSDAGELTPQGLRVLGRLDSVIISGGENIAAEALEAQIAMHPAIAQVCVVGVPDAEWGERVTAVVELRKDAAGRDLADRTTLEAWTAERISGFRRPKSWLPLNELPLLPSGKLDRRAIATLARKLLTE